MTLLIFAEIRNLYIADADQVAKFEKTSGALEATKNGLEAISISLGQIGEINSHMDAIDKQLKTALLRSLSAGSRGLPATLVARR
jgi:hypothetical protein